MLIRLQKALADAGIASRRAGEKLIASGRVKVNGQVVTTLGSKVDPVTDVVEVDGKPIDSLVRKRYLMLNKPAGYVTTVSDPEGRRTVLDLLKEVKERVYPVGRLDYDTEGLLLLTNDGPLTFALTHPSKGVEKRYLAVVEGIPDQEVLERVSAGLVLSDGPTAPARVRLLRVKGGQALLEIAIHEGRNRQVRRMCEAIGYPVLHLSRTHFGGLSLGSLPSGRYRELSEEEIDILRSHAGLKAKV